MYKTTEKILESKDSSNGALTEVTFNHKKIHDGDHYYYADYSLNQATAVTIEFILTTPDTKKWIHYNFSAYSSAGATLDLYAAPTVISGGTSITPRNNNGNSLNTSGATLIKDPTSIGDDGIRVAGYLAGGGRVAGFTTRDTENVLSQNTVFLLRITSLANSNDISWSSDWYEHENIS